MGFWSNLFGIPSIPDLPNDNGPIDYNPGDPDMVEFRGPEEEPEARALPWIRPTAWSGYPESWATPNWGSAQDKLRTLIDVAWACIDLNASVLSSMPIYRMRNGRIIDSVAWMSNPDPEVYTSWQEFAKQLFWDFQLGEAFVLPMAHGSDGYPIRFRVVPPWLVNVELKKGARREYRIGGLNVTDEILHIRYQGNTADAHGHGPLESAAPRQVVIGLLQKYVQNLAETGGVPLYWLGVERRLSETEAVDLMDRWIESRSKYAGHPALVTGGATLNQAKSMSAQDLSLMELTQFNEARIAILLGVPPFLVGLPGATGSLTYSNIEQLFSFHDRSSLRPKATAVMAALDRWALPSPQHLELNRDDYTRPSLVERATAYKIMIEAGVMEPNEARAMERLHSEAAAVRLSGGGV
ncbi:portal protein [Mycobacterium phage MadKillah]|nr:portal protein [Mycobacterium phage MadKillah]